MKGIRGIGFGVAIIAAIFGLASAVSTVPAPATPRPVAVLTIEGVIDPVLVRYLERAYAKAEKMDAQCVLLQINTPGGLETSMREINAIILNSKLPTIAYVSPKGSRAASAGAFIVLACNFTAMAPGTTMGAAHPVGAEGKDIKGNMDKKITNDTVAYIRSLAAQRGRDVKWAESAVRQSVSVNENDALKLKLIDCIAEDQADLLAKLDGKSTKIAGKRLTLALHGAPVVPVVITMRERLFHAIANPEIAYILLMLGTVGLIFEFQSSTLGISGLLGVVCLVLGMISLSVLPFNLGGLIFILLGIGLMIAELKFATHGVLTICGAACLLLGSLMLFSPLEPFFQVSRLLIFSTVGMMAAFFVLVAYLGIQAQRAPKKSGKEILPGATGEAMTALSPSGIVHILGEDWSATVAHGAKSVRKGEVVVVKSVEGLRLVVEPAEPREPGSRDKK